MNSIESGPARLSQLSLVISLKRECEISRLPIVVSFLSRYEILEGRESLAEVSKNFRLNAKTERPAPPPIFRPAPRILAVHFLNLEREKNAIRRSFSCDGNSRASDYSYFTDTFARCLLTLDRRGTE